MYLTWFSWSIDDSKNVGIIFQMFVLITGIPGLHAEESRRE